jgi:beta-lactamase regulating signal transducer with metallopeptidase domain
VSNPETIRVLGWCLLHFVWQGAVLALILSVVLSRLSSARARYASAVCVLGAMMIAPFVTFAILLQPAESVGQFTIAGLGEVRDGLEAVQLTTAAPDAGSFLPFSSRVLSIDWMSYAVFAWFVGVYMFTLRTLGGWMLIMRFRRQRAEPIAGDLLEICLALQRRIGVSQAVRYVCSKAAETPAVLGWLKPVVVLPLSALAGLSAWQVEAIVAHELAHIKRWDILVNGLQIVAETLLFYHPAVWWVNRLIRNEREHCCDDVAVEVCGNAREYARALALLEESRSTSVWALAATGGVLSWRIGRLLGLSGAARSMSTAGLAALGGLCAAGLLMAGTTAAQLQSVATVGTPVATIAPIAPITPAPLLSVAPVKPIAPLAAEVIHTHMHLARLEATDAAGRRSKESVPQNAGSQEGGSYIAGLQSAGLTNLTVDEIIALKIQGVTPEFVRQIKAVGLDARNSEFVSLKIHDVTPEYVHALAAAGLANLRVHDYLAAKIQGITPEFVQAIRGHGFKDLTLRQLIALKMAGIS